MTEPRFCRRVDVLSRRSLDTVVLLGVGSLAEGKEPIALGGSGPAVWDRLVEPHTLDELVAALAEAHGADPVSVASDVLPLLEQLLDLGAIEIVG